MTTQDDTSRNDEILPAQDQPALPNPMDVPEIEAPKEKPNPPIIIKKGIMSHPFVATLFLIAFFMVSFTLGMYVERTNKLTTALNTQPIGTGTVAGAQAVQGTGNAQPQQTGLDDGMKVTASIKAEPARTKGRADAKVTIYEFSDFQCPFCESFYTQAYKDILKQYVDSGKAKIVFKDYPLSFHPMAQSSAEAARCAQEQGKFWEMHDVLFENQKSLSADNYKKWGASLGLDSQKFNSCVDSAKYKQAVIDDMTEGVAIGVQGTPTFVINGTALVGAQPFSMFQSAIDAALK